MNIPGGAGIRGFLTFLLLTSHTDAGTVGSCDDAALRAAVAAGGVAQFDCSGTIVLSNTIEITANVVLDGTGGDVTISGGGQHRLFLVHPGVQFTLRGLYLCNGLGTDGGAVVVNQGAVMRAYDCVFSNNVAAGQAGIDGALGTNGLSGRQEGNPDYNRAGNGQPGGAGNPAAGGAIANFGELLLSNCVFAANMSLGGNGGDGGAGGNGVSGGGGAGSGGRGGSGGAASGGAVFNASTALVLHTIFTMNTARGGAGGRGGEAGASYWDDLLPWAGPDEGAPGGATAGGAIFSSGVLVLSNCSLLHNASRAGRGGAGGDGTFTFGWNGRPTHGTNGAGGGAAYGGAMFASGVASVLGGSMVFNRAEGGAGGDGGWGGSDTGLQGRVRGGDGGLGGNAHGGGITLTGSTLVSDCLISKNFASGGAGALGGSGGYRHGISGIGGKGGDTAGAGVSVLGGTNYIRTSVLSSNVALGGFGGSGLQTWNVVSNNSGAGGRAMGGGLANSAVVCIDNVSVEGNKAVGGEGGAGTESQNRFSSGPPVMGALGGDAFGAGIYTVGRFVGVASSVSYNTSQGGKGGDGGPGGYTGPQVGGNGFYAGSAFGGGFFLQGEAFLTNSTVGFNAALGGRGGDGGTPGARQSWDCFVIAGGDGGNGGSGFGGGLYSTSNSNVLEHVTMASNEVQPGSGGMGREGRAACDGTTEDGTDGAGGTAIGGGIRINAAGVTLRHIILAYNNRGNLAGAAPNDAGLNLSSDDSYQFGSGLNGVDPLLGSLSRAGGSTATFPLLHASPAIDQVPAGMAARTDQRGISRPAGIMADIGAYEATHQAFGIFGRVTMNGSGVCGISVGSSNLTTTTDAEGYYRLGGLGMGTHYITPQFPGATFSPDGTGVTVTSNVFGADYELVSRRVEGRLISPNGEWLFHGLPRETLVVETSTTLTTWLKLKAMVTDENGNVYLTEVPQSWVPYRFYRARPE